MTEPAEAQTTPAANAAAEPVAFGQRLWRPLAAAVMALVCGSVVPVMAHATVIKVLCANGIKPVLSAITPRFETASGNTVMLDCAETGELVKRVPTGQAADLYIMPKRALDELAEQGKIAPAIMLDVASSTLGLAVRDDAPRPVDATADAFRTWLSAASSIVLTDPARGGVGSEYFVRLLNRLGISDELRPRLIFTAGAGQSNAELVASGKADVAVQLSHLIRQVHGVQLVPLPADFEFTVTFSAAVASTATDPLDSTACIRFLSEPAAASHIKTGGMEPGGVAVTMKQGKAS